MAVPFFKHTGIFTEMEIGALLASVNFSSLIHLSASLKFIIGALDKYTLCIPAHVLL